jgi:hypothetical protein
MIEFSGGKRFLFGRSTANQIIEAWWGLLRKSCTDWWIKYFKDLRDTGIYQDDDGTYTGFAPSTNAESTPVIQMFYIFTLKQ